MNKCEFCEKFDFSTVKAEVNKNFAHINLAICNTRFPKEEQFNFCPVCGRNIKNTTPKMTIKEFIKHIEKNRSTGKVYRFHEMTSDEEKIAKENGFVVVFGYSDYFTEFRGAIESKVGCFDGGRVYENNEQYITAVWDRAGIPWTYDTNIPHESFSVWDDKDISLYCHAIVFDISEIKKKY